ncbi:MAG TPA: hypothetical protein VJA85_02455 [Candidatus Limnocylindria bacterium]|nr:hypothetical protein [Candidatus Limnocylindria bacterium]
MPRSTRAQFDSRAAARRRSRQHARGEVLEEDGAADESSPATTPARRAPGGLLSSLFPAAAPLRGMPDPFAGFTYRGPRLLSGWALTGWLLGRSPRAWLGMGALWMASRLVTWVDQFDGKLGIEGTIGSFVGFGALIAAGWIGWRRPWLYGLFAALVGVLGYALVVTLLAIQQPSWATYGGQWFAAALAQDSFQVLFGALGGWYGGYFRRRVATPPPPRGKRKA